MNFGRMTMTLNFAFVAIIYLSLKLGWALETQVLSSIQSSYETQFQNHCPRGFTLFSFSTNITPYFDSHWTFVALSYYPSKLERISSTTNCALMLLSNLSVNQTDTILAYSKPLRKRVIIVELQEQQGLSSWLDIGFRSKVPFLVTMNLPGSKVVPFYMICPFQDRSTSSRPVVYWIDNHGFNLDLVGVLQNGCNGCSGHWTVGFTSSPTAVVTEQSKMDSPTGFEVDVVELVAEQLGVTLTYVLDGSEWTLLNGHILGQRTLDVHTYVYDLSIGNTLTVLPNQEYVDFTDITFFFDILYGSRIPIPIPNYLSIVRVLSLELWIAIITSNILISFSLYALIKIYEGEVLKINAVTKPRANFKEILVRISIGLTEPEHVRWFPNLCGGSIATGAFYFYSMILCMAYTSTLLSMLIQANKEHPVDNSADAWKRGTTIYTLNYIDFLCTDCPNFQLYPEDLQKVAYQIIKTNGMVNDSVMGNVTKYLRSEIFQDGAIVTSSDTIFSKFE
ncbi:uncharacterized protein LOC131877764 isoform X2 [Tigriopus californicus]|uniref:uncharacterized protein LOC131877764 isoform X2 n=1 Tax=Tigriopus californicus TaxID=6832 RepID=UPI0027D9DC6D|nr:uncharacterized protein LOC131877764 isoform X2 [Tigriopus californicus]